MQKQERQKFEENWKSAFDGAEMNPPDRVWNSIELDLAGQESAAMKKRVVFYQRLAAAFLLFSLATGIYAFYPKTSPEVVAVKQEAGDRRQEAEDRRQETGDGKQEPAKPQQSTIDHQHTATQPMIAALNEKKKETKETKATITPTAAITTTATPDATETIALEESTSSTPPIASPLTSTGEDTDKERKEETIAIVSPLLQLLEEPNEVVEPKRNSRSESNLWLALGASAGNYSPNTPTATNASLTNFGPSLDNLANASQRSEPKVGTSYSVGMAVGKKFGRIVVQTGVNLSKQQIEYSSNYSAQTKTTNSAKAVSSDYLQAENAEYLMAFTPSPYTVNSTMEVVSIPVQAGYMIIDRKLGWQFNAGVSPDFFIRNVLVDESGQRERFTQSAGEESPYRTINWTGLLNTELSYRIGEHYRLSLVPGVRYSFNSILKEPTNSGRPVIIDVGFRFRYLFD